MKDGGRKNEDGGKRRTKDGRVRAEVKSLKKNVGNASPLVKRSIAFLFLHNLRPPSSVLRPSQGFPLVQLPKKFRAGEKVLRYDWNSPAFPLVQLPKKFRGGPTVSVAD